MNLKNAGTLKQSLISMMDDNFSSKRSESSFEESQNQQNQIQDFQNLGNL